MKAIQNIIYSLQRGQAQSHVYAEDLKKIKIPCIPTEIQQKIIDEIEVLEKEEKDLQAEANAHKENIISLLQTLYDKSTETIRLSDEDIFEVKIGKRVLKSEVSNNGKYPIYSANVFEPFGFINKELLTDFSIPSVLWGIDGDWMVNVMPKTNHFTQQTIVDIYDLKNLLQKKNILHFV